MSDMSTKIEPQRSTEGPAKRTYASLETARGFRHEPVDPKLGTVRVSICPLDTRTYWRHVGGGRWDSDGAVYERTDAGQEPGERETPRPATVHHFTKKGEP
jgi:hypothetical protein